MMDGLKTFGECKINLTMKKRFITAKDDDKSQPMHSKSNNEEANDLRAFDSLFHKYQIYLEQSAKGSNFVFGDNYRQNI